MVIYSQGNEEVSEERKDRKMKIYIVWYVMDNGTANIWNIKATAESASKEVEKIKAEGYSKIAWYNEELVEE